MTTFASPTPTRGDTGLDETGRMRVRIRLVSWVVLAGIMVELAVTRHWSGGTQLIAWAAVALAATGLAAITVPGRPSVGPGLRARVGQGLLGLVCLLSAVGVWEHISANYNSGPLDRRYATTWDSMSMAHRSWLSISGGVGPTPPFVPGMLALVSVLGLLSLIRKGAPASRSS
jgi:hypothetical protein